MVIPEHNLGTQFSNTVAILWVGQTRQIRARTKGAGGGHGPTNNFLNLSVTLHIAPTAKKISNFDLLLKLLVSMKGPNIIAKLTQKTDQL